MTEAASIAAPLPAPIIVSALFGGYDQADFDRLRKRYFPQERNHLDAHLTLFHHLPPTALPELKQRLSAATRGVRAPRAEAARLINLGRGVAIRIVSPGLEAVRAELGAAFAAMLTPQDRAGWRPHVTIQNKVSPVEAKEALAALSASFTPRSVRIAGLATWYYRGGPWQAIQRYMFG